MCCSSQYRNAQQLLVQPAHVGSGARALCPRIDAVRSSISSLDRTPRSHKASAPPSAFLLHPPAVRPQHQLIDLLLCSCAGSSALHHPPRYVRALSPRRAELGAPANRVPPPRTFHSSPLQGIVWSSSNPPSLQHYSLLCFLLLARSLPHHGLATACCCLCNSKLARALLPLSLTAPSAFQHFPLLQLFCRPRFYNNLKSTLC